MPSIEVTTYHLADYDAMSAAFRQLTLSGWTGGVHYSARGPGQEPQYYLQVEKAGNSSVLSIGDDLVSLGGGVLMTQKQYDAAFGGS